MTTPIPVIIGIPDLCAELFAHAIQLPDVEPGSCAELRTRTLRMLEDMERRAQSEAVQQSAIDQARFAIVAFLDEIVMTSGWPIREEWAAEPLQYKLFNSLNAGEEFFTRLDELSRGGDPRKYELLEVYATCLSLGFRGMYTDMAGVERLRGLLGDTTRTITAGREDAGTLAPNWERKERVQDRVRKIPPWMVAVGGALVALFVLLLCMWTLDSKESDLVAALESSIDQTPAGK